MMSQRKKVSNPANNYSLKDQFLQQTGRPVHAPQASDKREQPAEGPVPQNRAQPEKEEPENYDWDRWTIICRKEFKQKITAISEKEGFTIREIVEKFFTDGIAAYEAKHGVIDTTPKKKKNIDSLT
jgi:hypothetical protein